MTQALPQHHKPLDACCQGAFAVLVDPVAVVHLLQRELSPAREEVSPVRGEAAPMADLTALEAEVLFWTGQGQTNEDLGQILNIRLSTAKKHVAQVFEKQGVDNRTAAIQTARQRRYAVEFPWSPTPAAALDAGPAKAAVAPAASSIVSARFRTYRRRAPDTDPVSAPPPCTVVAGSSPAQQRLCRPGPFVHRPSRSVIMTQLKTSKLFRATALALASGQCTLAWAADRAPDLRTGQWVQWLYSIPASVSPVTDATGQNCMVGQSGSTWRLAPRSGGGQVQRACSVPQGIKLQFAVAGSAYIYTPGFCGDVPGTPVRDLRAAIAAFTDTLTVDVMFDGQPVTARRIRSTVFDAALPADNLFTQACGGPGSVPAGIYLGVDDTYYAEIDNLPPGTHTLELLATNGGSFNQNVMYTLTVVPRDPN